MAVIARYREGVPQWDGAARTFEEYSELAERWEQTVPYRKKCLCNPKLLNELSDSSTLRAIPEARMGVTRWGCANTPGSPDKAFGPPSTVRDQ